MISVRDRISLAFCNEDYREAERLCNQWVQEARREADPNLLAEALASLANAVESRGNDEKYLRDLACLVVGKEQMTLSG